MKNSLAFFLILLSISVRAQQKDDLYKSPEYAGYTLTFRSDSNSAYKINPYFKTETVMYFTMADSNRIYSAPLKDFDLRYRFKKDKHKESINQINPKSAEL